MPNKKEGKPIGQITHYFGHISVAVITKDGFKLIPEDEVLKRKEKLKNN